MPRFKRIRLRSGTDVQFAVVVPDLFDVGNTNGLQCSFVDVPEEFWDHIQWSDAIEEVPAEHPTEALSTSR
jgi:hypothetical protein